MTHQPRPDSGLPTPPRPRTPPPPSQQPPGRAPGARWRRDVVPARRHLSCSNLPLEELFARGGPLRTFLERQVGSEAQLQVRRPELVAVAKLLSDKEQELQETQHLLHGKGLV